MTGRVMNDWKAWQAYAAGAAVCAGLTLGAWVAVVRPLARHRDEYRARRAELASHRERADALASALGEWNRRLAEARQALERAPLRLEPESRINERLDRVTSLAVDGGLLIDEMQPGEPETARHYRVVPVKIVGKGSYPAVAAFLHRLRAQFPDTGTRSFEAVHSGPEPESSALTFHLELVWFTALQGK